MNSERVPCLPRHLLNGLPSLLPVQISAIQLCMATAKPLALLLLVLGIFADNHDVTLALDDLALLAHRLDGRSHFHVC